MQETKLTVRVSREVLAGAKRFARENDTTLTRLVEEYLRRLTAQTDPLVNAPIVRRLAGSLSPSASPEDYRHHLDEEYGP